MIQIQAHRGASSAAPENTMAAFQKAIELKADGIELDVHLSADRRLVVIHDETIERVSNGEGYVSDMSYVKLKRYNFAHNWNIPPEKIPLLDEVIELISPTDLHLNIELKTTEIHYNDIEQICINCLKRHKIPNLYERVLFSSYNPVSLRIVKELSIFHTARLYDKKLVFPWKISKSVFVNAIHPSIKNICKAGADFIRKCHDLNVAVNVWTVNDPNDAFILKNLGVDGIITNKPDVIRNALYS